MIDLNLEIIIRCCNCGGTLDASKQSHGDYLIYPCKSCSEEQEKEMEELKSELQELKNDK